MAERSKTRITITDLPQNAKVSEEELKRVNGGSLLRMPTRDSLKIKYVTGLRELDQFSQRIFKF